MSEQERKITINDQDYNFDDLSQEQQILVEHIENCRRNKSQLAFNIDRENVAEGAFVQMLSKAIEDQESANEDQKKDDKGEKDA